MKRTEPSISFAAYGNYLRAIRYVLAREYGSGNDQLPALSLAIQARPSFQRIQRRARARPERLTRLINIAWQTEVALNLPRLMGADGREFAAISIHWGTIQLYYAVYAGASAWLEAMQGDSAPKDHRAVLNALADYTATKAMFPLPWGAACRSCTPVEFCGETTGHQPQSVNPLTSPSHRQSLDLMCLALKTTREQELERRVSDWKQHNNRKRITRVERGRKDAFAPTTVFDFLWRLRVRANYIDADMFLAGGQFEPDAVRFLESLCGIGAASLFLFEKLLARAYGRQAMDALARDFLAKSRYAEATVGQRITYW